MPFTATAPIKITVAQATQRTQRGGVKAGEWPGSGRGATSPLPFGATKKCSAENDFIQFRGPPFFSAGHPRDACLAAISPDWTPSGGYFRANCTRFSWIFFFSSRAAFPRVVSGCGLAVDPRSAEQPSIDLKTVRSRAWRCISRIQGSWVLLFLQGQQTCELGAAWCSVVRHAGVLRPRPCSTRSFATRSFRTPWDGDGDARRVPTALRFVNESRRRRPLALHFRGVVWGSGGRSWDKMEYAGRPMRLSRCEDRIQPSLDESDGIQYRYGILLLG